MSRIERAYTRKCGLCRTYTYTATWDEEEQGLAWYAKVHFEGELKGRMSGIVLNHLVDTEVMVTSLVESSIEKLIQMNE